MRFTSFWKRLFLCVWGGELLSFLVVCWPWGRLEQRKLFTCSSVFAGSHKVVWHSDINHVWGLTGGWGSLFDQVCGDTPCPHPQLLRQHLFTSSGLSLWKALLSLSKSYMTHTDNTLTHKRICLVLGWLAGFPSKVYCMLLICSTQTDSWHSD